MTEQAIIVLEHVSKYFGKTEVIKEISLKFCAGKIYGFVGYNGSGKTVLFKCICGFLKPEKGNIYVRGRLFKDEILSEAGIIIENPAFLSGKTGFKNLELLYLLNHKRNKKHIMEVLEKVGLNPKSNKTVKHYSLGMRQRLAIAQAIMEEQEILILDEPMNGLDKQGIDDVRKMLLEMRGQGKLILLASHNKEDIEILCDEVYEMEAGSLKILK